MTFRLLFLGSTVAALATACVTPPPPPTPPPTTTAAASSELPVLRERVARLEKRLADVDARLGLLLARGDTERRPALRFDSPRGEQRAVDLSSLPSGGAGDSVDIDRGDIDRGDIDRSDIDRGDAIHDALLAASAENDGGGDTDDTPTDNAEPVVLRLRGTPSGAGSGNSEPRAAATSSTGVYERGQARLKEGRHAEAIAAFEELLDRFPKDHFADNALYWAAFCHQARGDHRQAIEIWQKLPRRFPRSAKIPDALFGMARSHEALGEPALAEALYDEVVHSYPKAEKLKDARNALQRLRPPR